ncbi:hypothetical protein VMCG_03135 [Cytospora schulzeri]|uniref:Nucleic acid-binding, OB-fold protein n=1 Tax=Cytospora schulzeri TaxID=448051 RepID=A0A423WXQ0_9PEZI|nr:hypothetical protein VMCG_03135 [Valsa malicola]
MGKLVILTGAPESDRLDWTTPDLLQTFLDPIARFANLQPSRPGKHPPPPTSTGQQQAQQQQDDNSGLDLAVWRSLPLQRTHVPTGFSQQHDLNLVGHFPSSADFLTTTGISIEAASQGLSQEDAEEETSRVLAKFYEHSLAVHDDLASSQLVVPPSQNDGGGGPTAESSVVTSDTGTKTTTTSFTSDEDSTHSLLAADDGTMTVKTPLQHGRPRGVDHHLSDLEDIPTARYLLSVLPQTITVTLIVGIISIAAPRTVETRYGTSKTLVEVLVGDETKSGFSVTFWLSSSSGAAGAGAGGGGGGGADPGGGVLSGLRGQDVVLMQNVALNVFRGKVYGGSLRKDMTRVFLLYRGRRVDDEDVGGHYSNSDLVKAGKLKNQQQQQHPQLEKTKRVDKVKERQSETTSEGLEPAASSGLTVTPIVGF